MNENGSRMLSKVLPFELSNSDKIEVIGTLEVYCMRMLGFLKSLSTFSLIVLQLQYLSSRNIHCIPIASSSINLLLPMFLVFVSNEISYANRSKMQTKLSYAHVVLLIQ